MRPPPAASLQLRIYHGSSEETSSEFRRIALLREALLALFQRLFACTAKKPTAKKEYTIANFLRARSQLIS
jgi:hypothetical protein